MEVHFLLLTKGQDIHTVAKDKDGDGNDDDSEHENDGDKALIIGLDPKYLWDGEFWRNMGVWWL